MVSTDIFVNIGASVAEFNSKINKAMSKLQAFRQMSGSFSKNLAGSGTNNFLDGSDLEKQEATVNRLQENFGRMGTRAKTATNNITGIGDALQDSLGRRSGFNQSRTQGLLFADAMVDAQSRAEQFNNTAKNTKSVSNSMADSFDAAALGVMFFGMQIQRIFTGIIRSGVKTFNSVMGQLEDTTTATDRLSGAFKFLKFEIGEALQPVMSFLVPIVAQIGEWVDANPKLARSILVVGAAVGSLLFAVGALQLGFKAISAAMTSGGFLYKGFSVLAGIMSPVGAAIAAIVAGIAGIGTLMTSSDFFNESFTNNILDPIVGAFKDLGSSLAFLIPIGDVLLGILTFLTQILAGAFSAAINLVVDGVGAMVDAWESFIHIVKAAKAQLEAFIASKLGMDAKAARQQAAAQHNAAEALKEREEMMNNINEANKAVDKAGSQMGLAFQALTEGGIKFSQQKKFFDKMDEAAKSASKTTEPNMSLPMSRVPSGAPMSELPDGALKDTAKESKKQSGLLASIDSQLKQLNNSENLSPQESLDIINQTVSNAR